MSVSPAFFYTPVREIPILLYNSSPGGTSPFCPLHGNTLHLEALVKTVNVLTSRRTTCFKFDLFFLNRKRAKAKMCTILAWQTNCNQSDMADGIFNKIIAISNPFCDNDKDPWAVEADLCANYSIPYRNPECASCPAEPRTHTCPPKNAAGIERGVVHHLLNIFFFTAAILQL